MVENSEKMING